MFSIKKGITKFLSYEKSIKDYAAKKVGVKSITEGHQEVKELKYMLFFWFVIFVSF